MVIITEFIVMINGNSSVEVFTWILWAEIEGKYKNYKSDKRRLYGRSVKVV
jgi:hypothetical protein